MIIPVDTTEEQLATMSKPEALERLATVYDDPDAAEYALSVIRGEADDTAAPFPHA